MIKGGVRLVRTNNTKRKSRAPSGFSRFATKQEDVRVSNQISLKSCGGRKQRWADLSAEWFKLDDVEQRAFASEAKAHWASKQERRRQPSESDADADAGGRPSVDAFWGLGDGEFPFSPASLRRAVRSECGKIVGALNYCAKFREKLRKAGYLKAVWPEISGADFRPNLAPKIL